MIRIRNLSKAYSHTLFSDFNLDIHEGEITAILGFSGCGKTTLLNILMELDKDYNGIIEMEGNPRISAVFQENRLLEECTVARNLMAVSSETALNEELIKGFGLQEAYHKKVRSLSGGMKRRVALARAVVYGGELFLFDEPFQGIDLAQKKEVMKQCKQYLKGKTCVIVTHSIFEAMEFAERIVVLGKQPVCVIEEICNTQRQDRDALHKQIKAALHAQKE